MAEMHDMVSGKWEEIKGDLQRMWGRLTDEEIEEARGNLSGFTGMVQRKYGIAQDEVRRQIDEVFNKYKNEPKNDSETSH